MKSNVVAVLWDKYNIMKKATISLGIIWYPCFIVSKLSCIHKLRFDDLWKHIAWQLQSRWTMHKFNSTFLFKIHAKQLIFTFTGNFQEYRLIFKSIIVLHQVISALACRFICGFL